MSECPFSVGQTVIFEPDARTLGLQVMVENLTPGEQYTVSRIADGLYVSLEGHESSAGGLHWSAFKPA